MNRFVTSFRSTITFAVGASVLTAIAGAQTPAPAVNVAAAQPAKFTGTAPSILADAQTAVFTVKPLPNITNGTTISVLGINSNGEAVGMVGDTHQCQSGCAAVWEYGIVALLEPINGFYGAPPLSINNAGQVVGQVFVGSSYQAVIWNDAMPTLLPLPGSQYTSSYVSHINNAGQAVGSVSMANGGPATPVVWNGSTAEILDVVSPYPSGVATAVDDSGLVVGTICCTKQGDNSAVVWHGTAPTGLPKLEPYSGTQAVAINKAGIVVGRGGAEKEKGGQVAIAWADNVATDLGNLAASGALAINDRGIIVGFVGSSGDEEAVVWSRLDASFEPLSSLISATASQEIVLTEATGINNNCVIVANGYNRKTMAANAFVLRLNDQSRCVNGGF